MAYKRDLSKPLSPTFGDDKPKKKVKRKTKEAVVREYKDAYYKMDDDSAKKQLQKDKREYTTGIRSRYGIDVGVKKTTKRKDGSVKKTKSTVSGTRYKNNNQELTKSKVKYNKDGSVKKSKTTVKSLTGKTKTKTNQKGQTKTKNVTFKNRKKADKIEFVNDSNLLRGRTKAKRQTARQDTKAAKAKKKAAPKKRRVVTRTKNK